MSWAGSNKPPNSAARSQTRGEGRGAGEKGSRVIVTTEERKRRRAVREERDARDARRSGPVETSQIDDQPEEPLLTRRQYLERSAIVEGAPWMLAKEAVATTAIEHPEWDMDEQKTWTEWER